MSQVNQEGGYVHLYRRLWDHPVFRDIIEASVFAWMMSTACWRPTRVRYKHLSITLERGQLALSTRDMATKWGWSEAKARRYLERLAEDGMISVSATSGVGVITITNYDEFQPGETDAAPTQHRRTYAPETDAPSDAPSDAVEGAENKVSHGHIDAAIDAATDAVPTHVCDSYSSSTDAQNKEGKKERKKDNRDSPPLSPSQPKPKSTASRGTKIPADWTPGEKGTAYAADKGNSPDQIRAMAEHFVNDRTAKGVVMKDWDAAWRTWVNNDIKFHGDPRHRAAPTAPRRSGSISDAADNLFNRIDGRNS